MLLQLSFAFYLHGICFSILSLWVYMCLEIWSGFLVDSMYMGLIFLFLFFYPFSQSVSFGLVTFKGIIDIKVPIYFLRCNWIFWSCQEACGILVSWIRTELVPVASEAQSLNRWTIRKSHDEFFLFNTKIVLCFLNIIKSTLFITNRVRLYWICFGLNYVIITWVLNIQIINKQWN